jgi:hypothetical protein
LGRDRRDRRREPERFQQGAEAIDAETSDYVLGLLEESDTTKRRRQIDVKVTRKGSNIWFRKEYVLKPAPQPVSSSKK